MKIWITGVNGQLGIELQKQLKETSYEVIGTGRELNIAYFDVVEYYAQKERPNVIINCAAYTAVERCEEDIENAYMVNAIGPKNLAIIAEKVGAKLVQVSTDYVFDDSNSIPHREDDRTNPKSIYGSSKLLGEEYVKAFCRRFFIIRTAWLYGEGKNFVHTMLKLAQTNDQINVVGDQIGSPTSTKDLARTIIDLMSTEYYGTFHGTCEGACSWYDFACKIFELKSIDIRVNKITSEQFVCKVKRPHYSVLDNFMLKLYGLNHFRRWEVALEEYLSE